jgi:DNA mismatch repair protein MutS2
MGNNSANNNVTKQALTISGPNGGEKTLALQSFGLCAVLCKLGIPIPVDKTINGEYNEVTRVDYFEDILIDLGDSQSVSTGYSTLMAKLNTCSRIIKRIEDDDNIFDVDEKSNCSKNFLVLLDELGSGTDPESGSAIARAILEYLIEPKYQATARLLQQLIHPSLNCFR